MAWQGTENKSLCKPLVASITNAYMRHSASMSLDCFAYMSFLYCFHENFVMAANPV